MQLSAHFSLEELTLSNTAIRAGVDNTPPAKVVLCLIHLASVLEVVRQIVNGKPIHINSGYRSLRLNQMIGGSKSSAHVLGLAADIICPEFGTPLELCTALSKEADPLNYDQIIHEYKSWCHIGLAKEGEKARQELLTIKSDGKGYRMGIE